MSKLKLFIAALLIATVASVGTVVAKEVLLPETENIFTVADAERRTSTVTTFKHGGNRCYVVTDVGGGEHDIRGISCVRFAN